MLRGILPKEFAFYDYFDRHIEITIIICREFKTLTEHPELTEQQFKKIDALEKDADLIIHSCTDALHRTFITPIDRNDIFTLIKRMDDIADNIKTAASRMLVYEIHEIREEAVEMADILLQATVALRSAISGLRNIKNPDLIKEKCELVHQIEDDADKILRRAIGRLFKEQDAIIVIKWKEIFARIEKAIDRCENLAHLVEAVVIDNA